MIKLPKLFTRQHAKDPAPPAAIPSQPSPRDFLNKLVDKQLASGTPVAVTEAFQRLRAQGYSEEQSKELLVYAYAVEYYHVFIVGDETSAEHLAETLNALPRVPWDEPDAPFTLEDIREQILDNPDLSLSTTDDLQRQYPVYRAIRNKIQRALVKSSVGPCIEESARSLGLMEGKTIILDNEHDIEVVTDHALYADPGRRNRLFDTYTTAHPEMNAEERAVLAAMREARFRVMIVQSVVPGIGVNVIDHLHREIFVLCDEGLAATAQPNVMLVGHVITLNETFMSTGALLPVLDMEMAGQLIDIVDRATAPGQRSFEEANARGELTTRILGLLLRGGAGSSIRYTHPRDGLPAAIAPKINRNAPCPCGSGRKYKACCGRGV